MKILKILQIFIDFSRSLYKFAIFAGLRPRNIYKWIMLNLWPNFREKFETILKFFENGKFSIKIPNGNVDGWNSSFTNENSIFYN